MKGSRRQFIRKTGAGLLAAGAAATLPAGKMFGMHSKLNTGTKDLFRFGIAGWTFVNYKLDAALDMMARVDMHYLCIKNFHLPFDSTPVQIAEFHDKLKAKGVTGYAVGPIGMKSEAEADQAFAYCKTGGPIPWSLVFRNMNCFPISTGK